ncbi:MAG: ribosome maturation factor RimM [bacterium]|nr:ribosome maturation factor RimM [bacterium]
MTKLISVGKILNFHGIKGEVKVGYTKGKEQLIESLEKVFVTKNGIQKEYTVKSVRFHKQFALIKFEEINSINDVEEIKGFEIKIPKEQAESELTEDEFFVSDLIGAEVFNVDGEKIGEIKDVGTNGANEILEITDSNDQNHLVPFVKELVPVVDLNKHQVVVKDIEGLIE